ncbi:hypothetical protein SAMN04515668_2975 [Hymenobacter arizonensis]|uniref:TonB protein C-terminal n=2 Tax=Hymenobacter arizonensis TaxID=1227077 RepID=A0A1I5ZJT1_HYMAR|nr:hypothetical protein SAMN04515668_2975 [Hymenobacter arizonensis]
MICVICLTTNCQAQTRCDSIYEVEDKFWAAYLDKGLRGLILFDRYPEIAFGKDRLINYTDDKERIGAVMYIVLIDSLGKPSCLRFAYTNNPLLVEEANQIAKKLTFTPASTGGKGVNSTMNIIVRFYAEPPKRRRTH